MIRKYLPEGFFFVAKNIQENGRKTVGICFCVLAKMIEKRGENGVRLPSLIENG